MTMKFLDDIMKFLGNRMDFLVTTKFLDDTIKFLGDKNFLSGNEISQIQ